MCQGYVTVRDACVYSKSGLRGKVGVGSRDPARWSWGVASATPVRSVSFRCGPLRCSWCRLARRVFARGGSWSGAQCGVQGGVRLRSGPAAAGSGGACTVSSCASTISSGAWRWILACGGVVDPSFDPQCSARSHRWGARRRGAASVSSW